MDVFLFCSGYDDFFGTSGYSELLVQREIQEARFWAQTQIFIFPQNLEIPESHENPKSRMAPKMDSAMFTIFKNNRLEKSIPRELTRASRVKKVMSLPQHSLFFLFLKKPDLAFNHIRKKIKSYFHK